MTGKNLTQRTGIIPGGVRQHIKKTSVIEADNEFTPYVYDETYFNMELYITRDSY